MVFFRDGHNFLLCRTGYSLLSSPRVGSYLSGYAYHLFLTSRAQSSAEVVILYDFLVPSDETVKAAYLLQQCSVWSLRSPSPSRLSWWREVKPWGGVLVSGPRHIVQCSGSSWPVIRPLVNEPVHWQDAPIQLWGTSASPLVSKTQHRKAEPWGEGSNSQRAHVVFQIHRVCMHSTVAFVSQQYVWRDLWNDDNWSISSEAGWY